MDSADGARLDQLEADISAVASALETVDRIVAETDDGESAAAEIAVVVSPDRFRLDSDDLAPPVEDEGPVGVLPAGGPAEPDVSAEPVRPTTAEDAAIGTGGFPGSIA